ncbi:MAG: methyl-accepting chemotaxis protein [Myxococcales bacterium]
MLQKLKFRHLNRLSPLVAGASFICLLVVIPWLGAKSMEHLEVIRNTHIAAMQAAQRADLLVSRLQKAFQDATAASDAGGLEETKRLHAELKDQLQAIRSAGLRDKAELEQLSQAVDRYYKLSLEGTAAMIAGSVSEDVLSNLQQANTTFEQIQRQMQKGAESDQRALAEAFEQAAEANRSSRNITMGVALFCLITLAFLSIIVSGGMRSLVQDIVAVSAQINSAAAQMSAAANQHEQGASEQVSAVEETRRTMGALVSTGDQVNAAIDVVLRNAEQTQAKNQVIGESIARLSGTTERIGEILESIRDIAHKSDLLALNAALEGTKAGEAGRGFSLVATQMQRLAENVMESVVNVKGLTADIRRASGASVLATEEGTKLAQETTRSAREIRMVMQQYQAGTEQVSAAMNDISQVGQQSAISSRQVHSGSKDLAAQSERLLSVIERFRFDEQTAK